MSENDRKIFLENERRKQEKEIELAKIKQEKNSAEKLLKKQNEIRDIEEKLRLKEKEILTKHEEEMKKRIDKVKEKNDLENCHKDCEENVM